MARTEPLKLHDQIRSAARSIGVRNRQPRPGMPVDPARRKLRGVGVKPQAFAWTNENEILSAQELLQIPGPSPDEP